MAGHDHVTVMADTEARLVLTPTAVYLNRHTCYPSSSPITTICNMQIFSAILAFVALYSIYSEVYSLLASDSCVAGIAIFIAAAVIDRLFEGGVLAVGVCLVFYEIISAQWSPGGIIFAFLALNEGVLF